MRRRSDYFEIVGRQGSLRTAGVLQRIAGKSCDVGIVDDPFGSRGRGVADDPQQGLALVHGRLLHATGKRCPGLGDPHALAPRRCARPAAAEHARQDGRPVDRLAFPAIKAVSPAATNPYDTRQAGEPLWPEFKLLEELQKIEAQDRRMFAALYQLNPAEAGGTEWPPEYFGAESGCREEDWPHGFQIRVMSVDPSKGASDRHGDYCAIVFLGLCNETLYVDANLEPRNAKDIVRVVRQFADLRRPEAIGFETDQFQQLLADQMQADDAGHVSAVDDPADAHPRRAEGGPHPPAFAVRHQPALQVPGDARLPAIGRSVDGFSHGGKGRRPRCPGAGLSGAVPRARNCDVGQLL